MVLSGLVISVNRADQTGVIETVDGREFFFSINECCENELPPQYATVTFIKDRDFKTTNVAALIKRSQVFKKIG